MEEALDQILNFEDLPSTLQFQIAGSNPEQVWYNKVLSYHADRRTRWKGFEFMNFYRDLIRFLRVKLEIFPYHLCRYLNFTSPFDYYIEMLCDLLRTQKTYDTLPTFTAADILRIIGIHRNSYSDLLHKCKEKGWVSKISRAIRGMLPKIPLSVPVEAWWMVFPLLHKKTRKIASKNEIECLQDICKDFSNKASNYAGQYDRESLEGLYRAMVVEFDIEMEEVEFEVVRDTKSFIPDKLGFGRHMGEVLKCSSMTKDITSICQYLDLSPEIVKDSLSILSRLGFLDVSVARSSEWHRSWQPLSDPENSITSIVQSVDEGNGEDSAVITVAISKSASACAVKAVKEILARWQVKIIESSTDALVVNSVGSDPLVFTNLSNAEAPLYRLFKLKYCRTSPVLYLQKGFVMTVVPRALEKFQYFLLHTENGAREVQKNQLLDVIYDILPMWSAFVIPLKHRFLSIVTVPLPINILEVKDRALVGYLRDLDLISHFENFVGYLEVAALADKKYMVINQFHGIPMHNKELAVSVAHNLGDTPWLKYNTLEVVGEAQQNEVFQYREFICDVDVEQGFIVIT